MRLNPPPFLDRYPVPEELKSFSSFVCWGPPSKPFDKTPINPKTGNFASVNKPTTWTSYQEASSYAERYGFTGVGFVLSDKDPFAIIDLDDPKGCPQRVAEQEAVFKVFESYSEISPSGRGLHIIVRGSVPTGKKRNGIEVYSTQRFMTVTGNAFRNIDIKSCQEDLSILWANLGGKTGPNQIEVDDLPQSNEDQQIIEIASNAANGELFRKLWAGQWEDIYETQSQADFALVDIIAFYSRNRNQIARLFLESKLANRPKAHRPDYMRWMLAKVFDNLLPPVNLSYLQAAIESKLENINLMIENLESTEATPEEPPCIFPPGILGELADYFYRQSARPIREAALAVAISVMAGLCGRAFNVSGTGLNLYVLMIAKTGAGKDATKAGIGKLLNYVGKMNPSANKVLGPAGISSPQALVRHMSEGNLSFLSVIGEFGLQLKLLSMPTATPAMVGLRRLLLELFSMSGQGQILAQSIYAESAKNTGQILSPNFSMLGDSTPEKFYENLDETMISEGLLSRFLIIEYKGDRPDLNLAHQQAVPSESLMQGFSALCSHAESLNNLNSVVDVLWDEASNREQALFERYCTAQINASSSEVRAYLWNRAHIKVLKLAALCAVGINPYNPVVTVEALLWAKDIVVRDCTNLISKFERGEVGATVDERDQMRKLCTTIVKYVITPYKELSKTVKGSMNGDLYHAAKCVPFSSIQRSLCGYKAFRDDRQGATNAIKKTIRTLIETGDIEEMGIAERKKMFGSSAPCYIISNPKLLDEFRHIK